MLPAITNTCISCWWGWLLLRTKRWGAVAATTNIEKEAFPKVFRHKAVYQWIQTTKIKTSSKCFHFFTPLSLRRLTSNIITTFWNPYLLKYAIKLKAVLRCLCSSWSCSGICHQLFWGIVFAKECKTLNMSSGAQHMM